MARRTDKTEEVFILLILGAVLYFSLILTSEQQNTIYQTMFWVLYSSVLLFIESILIIIWIKIRKQHKKYHIKIQNILPIKTLFTPTEKEFQDYLQKNLPTGIDISYKTRLADLTGNTNSSRERQMHVDYTLIDQKTGVIILAIELDDRSHDTKKAKERDHFKDTKLKESGITLIRVRVEYKYNIDIMNKIIQHCNSKTQ